MEQKMQTGSKSNSSNHEEEVEAGAVGRDAASWESAGWWSHTVLSASHLDSGRSPCWGHGLLSAAPVLVSRSIFNLDLRVPRTALLATTKTPKALETFILVNCSSLLATPGR